MLFCWFIAEMEAENKTYTHMQGEGSGQAPQAPPQYVPAAPQQAGPSQGYQQYPPTIAGSPYYAPPSAAGYGGGYGALPSQQQQQPQVTVVGVNQPPVIYVPPSQTYAGAMVYACIVAWLFNIVFGLIAYYLAGESFTLVRYL